MSTPPAASARFNLATRDGRKRAHHDLMWVDHGFLRAGFQNLHWISPDMARSNQPSPEHIARYAAMGIKTIVNLRGFNDSGHYWLEREACEQYGLVLVDTPISSRDTPSKERLWRAKEIFSEITYPALMHCKSGADRAGLYGVLYKHWRMGQPLERAIEQLSGRYLHVRAGKTGMLDYFFERAIAETKASGKSFDAWITDDYDPAAMKAQFMGSWWGNMLTEKILKRE